MENHKPLRRSFIQNQVVPDLAKMLAVSQLPNATQNQTIELICAIAHQMTEDGRTTAGQVILFVLFPDKTPPKHKSCTVALLRAKQAINKLFATAGTGIACHIDPENKKGDARTIFFTQATTSQQPPQQRAKNIRILPKEAVASALAQALKQRPKQLRTPRKTSRHLFSIIALLGNDARTTTGDVLRTVYPQEEPPPTNKMTNKLRCVRHAINRVFQEAGIPVTLVADSNRQAGSARMLYFIESAVTTTPTIDASLIPSNVAQANTLFTRFIKHCTR